jgi:hypothetical protein
MDKGITPVFLKPREKASRVLLVWALLQWFLDSSAYIVCRIGDLLNDPLRRRRGYVSVW